MNGERRTLRSLKNLQKSSKLAAGGERERSEVVLSTKTVMRLDSGRRPLALQSLGCAPTYFFSRFESQKSASVETGRCPFTVHRLPLTLFTFILRPSQDRWPSG